MNLTQRLTVALILDRFCNRGYFKVEELNDVFNDVTSTCTTIEDCVFSLIKKYNIKYIDFPNYMKQNYNQPYKEYQHKPDLTLHMNIDLLKLLNAFLIKLFATY